MKGENSGNPLHICIATSLDKNWKSSIHEKERIPKGLGMNATKSNILNDKI